LNFAHACPQCISSLSGHSNKAFRGCAESYSVHESSPRIPEKTRQQAPSSPSTLDGDEGWNSSCMAGQSQHPTCAVIGEWLMQSEGATEGVEAAACWDRKTGPPGVSYKITRINGYYE